MTAPYHVHAGGGFVAIPCPVKLTSTAPTNTIAVGDLVGIESGYAVPAHAFTWDTDTATTQTAFAAAFRGVSNSRSRAGVAFATDPRDQAITVNDDSDAEYRGYLLAAAQLDIGSYVGPAKNASANLLTQSLIGGLTKARSIGIVSRRMTASGTVVFYKLINTPAQR